VSMSTVTDPESWEVARNVREPPERQGIRHEGNTA